MIGSIFGNVINSSPYFASGNLKAGTVQWTIETSAGVGYQVVMRRLQQPKTSEQVRVFCMPQHFEADPTILWGFLNPGHRDLAQMIWQVVDGLGAASVHQLLHEIEPQRLLEAVERNQPKLLEIKGLGPKRQEAIVQALTPKLGLVRVLVGAQGGVDQALAQAMAVLQQLGLRLAHPVPDDFKLPGLSVQAVVQGLLPLSVPL